MTVTDLTAACCRRVIAAYEADYPHAAVAKARGAAASNPGSRVALFCKTCRARVVYAAGRWRRDEGPHAVPHQEEVQMKQTKKQPQKATPAPIVAKGQEQAVLEKLIRNAKDYDAAWQLIHRTFARKTYGRVRDVVQKFSDYKTLRAAFNAVHGKKAKRAKAELKAAA